MDDYSLTIDMKIMVVGDVNGRSGRSVLARYLPQLRQEHALDVVIVNADNAAHGRGVIPSMVKELYDLGVDLLTGGDHIWYNREMLTHLDRPPYVLRPLNYPPQTIGKGWHILDIKGKKILVIHALGRVLVERHSENPFYAVDQLVQRHVLGKDVDAIILDFHAEATSEKNAMGHFLDGRVSAVVGTHTHVPTADARILPKGTAYITDIGMTGDYLGIIGSDPLMAMQKFVTGFSNERLKPSEGEGTLCAVIITIDPLTGLSKIIKPIHIGGVLDPLNASC
jgi:metallophosphoesterase (TIGR00282 family)